jgi:uncharacterized metal-binding protein YceD (DUF177 family)
VSEAAPFSDVVRINQIGERLTRRLVPDAAATQRIARSLDLQGLDDLQAEMTIEPTMLGWRLTGRLRAHAVQTCGITLEPLPVDIDAPFSVELTEAPPEDATPTEIEIDLEDDSADLIEDGKIDLGGYLVEQLALNLDPFPRKEGAEFEQPPEPEEASPFAVLKAFKAKDEGQG